MTDRADWYTEHNEATGTAFSLKLGRRVHAERSEYQAIEVYQTETFGYLMTIDDCTMVSTRDNFLYHEMITHPALYAHPKPDDVLVIGGGDCGTLREVLAHDEVKRATQVELDERVTRVAEQYFPELCERNDDPRATLHFGDGIAWVRDAADASLDLIIVDSTDPVGPAEGLFGPAFYADCHRALRAGGLLVQQTESPLLHEQLIRDTHAAMRGAGFAATHLVGFPQPIYPSGWWSVTIAQRDAGELARRPSAVRTRYYNDAIRDAAFARPAFLDDL